MTKRLEPSCHAELVSASELFFLLSGCAPFIPVHRTGFSGVVLIKSETQMTKFNEKENGLILGLLDIHLIPHQREILTFELSSLRLFSFPQVSTDHLRIRLNFVRGPLGNFASKIEDDNPVCDVHHDPHIMFDKDDTTNAIP